MPTLGFSHSTFGGSDVLGSAATNITVNTVANTIVLTVNSVVQETWS